MQGRCKRLRPSLLNSCSLQSRFTMPRTDKNANMKTPNIKIWSPNRPGSARPVATARGSGRVALSSEMDEAKLAEKEAISLAHQRADRRAIYLASAECAEDLADHLADLKVDWLNEYKDEWRMEEIALWRIEQPAKKHDWLAAQRAARGELTELTYESWLEAMEEQWQELEDEAYEEYLVELEEKWNDLYDETNEKWQVQAQKYADQWYLRHRSGLLNE